MSLTLRIVALLLLLVSSQSWAVNSVKGVRIWHAPDNTRLVLDLANAPTHKVKRLSNPSRLEIELAGVTSLNIGTVSGDSPLVKRVYASRTPSAATAVVIELAFPVNDSIFSLPPSPPYGHRLVVDIKAQGVVAASNQTAPVTSVTSSRPQAVVSQPVSSAPQSTPHSKATGRDIIIAIDAGHGGQDPGAVGPKGTYEKNITLSISRQLADMINKQPGLKAVLTRTGDYYIHPNKRPDIARQKQADLLISVHADAVQNRKAHGASVWVLSMRRATTEVGRMLEQTEQHSELLGGVAEVIKDSANERYLAQTVLDLSMNHSMVTGFEVAKEILREVAPIAHLHKKEPQAASLAVLKAPDIPSILFETGFISNYNEERLLKDSNHQHKLALAMFRAIKGYFEKSPPADSLFAAHKNNGRSVPSVMPSTHRRSSAVPAMSNRTHKVKRGESLSRVAKQYGVSMAELRRHNNLKSDNILIGQVLRIP
ncbi:MAG: N-acetylmuramoyl-L-alanine amidase [Pararheinheimera sp.]|jgi:N-acetylmuramoyl-L-alanine amidase|uniref:N-acetylmuramoyl-L-alanine amidase n=1 Tax=uncultured Rheinheimera sp. TaxID=400532 RepID=UPI001B3F926F|nr:N-acetylmuramoyl-L-alanine amidase [uncultured Rheinheimera sp.]MBP8228564.1 N-acetylmuramoyl-L-alanine amidase [Rheinheimera sp.]